MPDTPQIQTLTDSDRWSKYMASLDSLVFPEALEKIDQIYTLVGQVDVALVRVYAQLEHWVKTHQGDLCVFRRRVRDRFTDVCLRGGLQHSHDLSEYQSFLSRQAVKIVLAQRCSRNKLSSQGKVSSQLEVIFQHWPPIITASGFCILAL